MKKMKKIKTHKELEKKIQALLDATPLPPFIDIKIYEGSIYLGGDVTYAPFEAARVGKFLLDFYGEPDDDE